MIEDPDIIRLNIRHYQELIKLKGISDEARQRIVSLLSEAEAQLPFARQAAASSQFTRLWGRP
jgi:hypothetical protein